MPDESDPFMKYTVCAPLARLYRYPSASAEHVDEALYGTQVEITDRIDGFCRVTTDYGYTGWADGHAIAEKLAEPNRVITLPSADLLPDARNYYAPVMTLPLGAKVDAGFSKEFERYAFVVLPDKRVFYIHKAALAMLPERPAGEDETRRTIVANAMRYFGVQYRWGGKTVDGIDCSGLAFMAYQLSGITIWRDADFEKTPALSETTLAKAKPGDLLFFSGHVAVYLGESRFLHASAALGRVGYGSFDPQNEYYSAWFADNLLKIGTLFND